MTEFEQRLAHQVRAYDALGIHRTGSLVDDACAAWLCQSLAESGVEARREELPVAALEIGRAHLEIGGQQIRGVPLFDAPPTVPRGEVGVVGAVGSDAPLGFACIDPNGQGLAEMRQSSRHRGLILVPGPHAPRPGLSLANAPDFEKPWGPPVLQIGNDHRDLLAASTGREARLTIETRRQPTRAANVVAKIEGQRSDLAPVVVMTPRSSWWHSTGERAGGLVVWLEMARELAAHPHARTVHFLASTGHELGHLGLAHYLRSYPTLIAQAHLWIHLGANFAATQPQIITQASDPKLAALLSRALARAGISEDIQWPPETRPLGEAANIFDGAGRYLSLLGGQSLFHHEQDRWPDNIDLEGLARIAGAFRELGSAVAADSFETPPK